MPYFDFENTPIESDIILKAKWCCSGGDEGYTGDWMRVFLANKNSYAVADTEEAAKAVAYYTVENNGTISGFHLENADGSLGAAVTFTANDIESIEIGMAMTTLAGSKAPTTGCVYNNLKTFICKSPKMVRLSSEIMNGACNTAGVDGYILFPPTLKSCGSFLTNGSNFIGTLDFQVPLASLTSKPSDTTFCTGPSSDLQYTQGIKITGPYANEWAAAYPNGQTSNSLRYRKFVKV